MKDENEIEEELLDFTKPDFDFKPNERHEWRQYGPYLICKVCQLEHAVYVGMENVLIGLEENGQPILKKR